MIIDMHRHLWSVFERYASVRDIAAHDAKSMGHGEPTSQDPSERSAQIIKEMDGAGVDRSIVMLGDYGLRLGEPSLSIEEENRLATDLAAKYPERFTAFFGIDPRREGSAEMFKKAVEQDGARGLKLHPCAGFFPNDRACYPLYEIAGAAGIPVAIHTGPLAAPLISRFADPIYIDEPAADFPDTTFIVLHSGMRCWFPIALDIARWSPNMYLELALWQRDYVEKEELFIDRLDQIKKAIGLDRVLFGSDCPGSSSVMSLSDWVQVFKDLPEIADRHNVVITDHEVAAMLGGTAQRVLGLDR
ncbi:hypothetical protein CLV47_106196 [Antricoccus suffuscus]|uniref:Amidohydrolase-related domain-containing protein n=1 Tax=Antricoccus suffuscus TaxID=1629062 RepID=A0A2T1A1B2_9ACTN|nr:amidohydrolase family protein [Antricoccus suffuscus]PRZ42324.1 hypothetical protein CLV47_106196 [Antricoccus suffuscus]